MNTQCRVVDSASVMYWGDVGLGFNNLDRIETANLDGSGRNILKIETNSYYYGFAYNDGNLYFTDLSLAYVYVYVCLRCL